MHHLVVLGSQVVALALQVCNLQHTVARKHTDDDVDAVQGRTQGSLWWGVLHMPTSQAHACACSSSSG